jgi:hypothetical protein
VLIIHPEQQQKRIPSVRLFFFLMEETFCPLSLSAKARRQNIRVSRRGRQLPPAFALAEPKVRAGKRKDLFVLRFCCLSFVYIINTLADRYCHRKKHLQGVHQPLPFSCGARDAKDDKDRQLSPSLNGPDVLPVRPKRHEAAVLLLCGKRAVENACRCFLFHIAVS